jgi:antitoxin component YwqK of YwqJK toxin-antitoxin module
MDRFLFSSVENGPYQEKVIFQDNIKSIAEYIYSPDGKLIQCIYRDDKQSYEGEVKYSYKNGRLVLEEVFGPTKSLLEKKEFKYNAQDQLTDVFIYDETNSLAVSWKLSGVQDGLPKSAEGKYRDAKVEREIFKVENYAQIPNSKVQNLFDDKSNIMGQIFYRYDPEGKLLEREYQQGNTFRLQTFEYDKDKALVSVVFHVKQGETWRKVKEHKLLYKDRKEIITGK